MTIGGPGQGETPQDISGAVTSVIVRYVRARVGDYGLAQTMGRAGDDRPVSLLEDPRSWSTHDQAIRLLAAAAEVIGDPDIGRHVGEEMLRQHDGTDVANLLRSLGSPGELLRNVTAAAAKFTTVSSLEPLEVGDAHAVVRAVTRPGFVRHVYLCEFTKGLLSQVPVLFGLVPAVVTETECQARGGRFCLYSVAWEARQWNTFVDDRSSLYSSAWGEQGVVEAEPELEVDPSTQIAELQQQLTQTSQRLEEVFSTASELLAVDDLSELLTRIMRRAAQAVNAPRYLLVIRTEPGTRAQLHQHGFADDEARSLAEELWRPQPDDAGGSRLIVDIASSRQMYGRLAAVNPPGMRFMDREREIFTLYGNYAATALDLVTALTASRRSNDTARALLEFSRSLSRMGTTDEVAQTLADTVPAVVGCQRSAVMLWDPFDQKLVFRAVSGHRRQVEPLPPVMERTAEPIVFVPEEEVDLPEEEVPEPEFGTITLEQMPMLHEIMASREIVVVDRASSDEFQRAALDHYGTAVSVLAPLFSDDEFLGIVAADFLAPPAIDPRDDQDLKERLSALADHAVTSFQNAWLLEQVGHLAWHDSLTGLPNRRLLEDRVVQELERAKRLGETSTMFFVDLDRFKRVNDTLGHAVGDDLLKEVARRLRDCVRRQDTVARLGGDEFAIMLPGMADIETIRDLAERMLGILHEPYSLEGVEVFTSASIGIAVSPDHGDTYDDLLSHADEAMYRAKDLGRNNYQLFRPLAPRAVPDAEFHEDLQRSIERGELFVLYHPFIDLATNQVVGVESLVRWNHPVHGILEPPSFIDEAESSDLIVRIDNFVINETCRQWRQWADEGLDHLRIAVNLSGRDLLNEGFVESVIDALRENSVPADCLEFELTERLSADAKGAMSTTAERLHQLGLRFSVDDFGTGSSSLRQLTEFPVNAIKVDELFVPYNSQDGGPEALAAAIIAMAEKLGLECIAEGVETEEQARLLTELNCSQAQGTFFSPPLHPADVPRLVREREEAGEELSSWTARPFVPSPDPFRPPAADAGADPAPEVGAEAGTTVEPEIEPEGPGSGEEMAADGTSADAGDHAGGTDSSVVELELDLGELVLSPLPEDPGAPEAPEALVPPGAAADTLEIRSEIFETVADLVAPGLGLPPQPAPAGGEAAGNAAEPAWTAATPDDLPAESEPGAAPVDDVIADPSWELETDFVLDGADEAPPAAAPAAKSRKRSKSSGAGSAGSTRPGPPAS